MINNEFKNIILESTEAEELYIIEIIQELWSGYGNIIRYGLKGSKYKSVVVKHIDLRASKGHPRGWNSNISHKRKIKSYQIEMEWYKNWSKKVTDSSPIPKCLSITKKENEFLIVLEDLNTVGFERRISNISIPEMKACLKWLANFHVTYLGDKPEGLWDIGCYWHLETRPDELEALSDLELKKHAKDVENLLTNAKYQTFVHGDAKLANFCFSENGKQCAMVDFQYVGEGPGIKDVAYFIGSCLYEEDCEKYEKELLDSYFTSLQSAIKKQNIPINFKELEIEWRSLYTVAWCDFHRFLKGWSPGHWKINSYSERLTKEVLNNIKENN